MITDQQRCFMESQPVAHLATADQNGLPHVMPICFVNDAHSLFVAVDQKPKKPSDRPLKRIRNVIENPNVTVIIDRYDDDWTKLGWIMLRGTAEILHDGNEYVRSQNQLKSRYPQYRTMDLAGLPVIAVRISKVTTWGNLTI